MVVQGALLAKLSDTSHVIELLARGECHFQDTMYNAILLQPYVEKLSSTDSLQVATQVRWPCTCCSGLFLTQVPAAYRRHPMLEQKPGCVTTTMPCYAGDT